MFFDTDVILNSSPDSKKYVTHTLSVCERDSNFSDTGFTVKTSTSSQKPTFSREYFINSSVAAQRPLLSPVPVTPAISPSITPQPIHILAPSDIDTPLFPLLAPSLTKAVTRSSEFSKHQMSFDATSLSCDKPITFVLQKIIDEPSTYSKTPSLNTTSDLSYGTFSVFCQKLPTTLLTTSSVDGFLVRESEDF